MFGTTQYTKKKSLRLEEEFIPDEAYTEKTPRVKFKIEQEEGLQIEKVESEIFKIPSMRNSKTQNISKSDYNLFS